MGIDLSRFTIGSYDGIGNETGEPFTVPVALTGQTPETQQRAVITVLKNLITILNLTLLSWVEIKNIHALVRSHKLFLNKKEGLFGVSFIDLNQIMSIVIMMRRL